MTLILSSALVLAATVDGLSLDHPVVGWHNVVTAAGIVADSAEANYPASNLANPATHLEWRAGQAGNQYLTITTGEVDPIDYVAVARHNWGSGEIPVSIEGFISGVWTEIVEETMLADDGPALWRFTGQSLSQIRIRLQASAGSVAGARTTTTISERDGGVVFAAAYTIVDMTKALIPGAIVSSIGIYSTLAGAFKVKIVKRNSVGNFDVVVSESFAHPGGGFVDHDLSSAYTIPSSGDYYLAALNDASISNDVALLISSRAFKIGDITGVAQSGFTEDGAAGHMLPMRYTYNALPRAAVVYCGKSLVLERKLYVGHTPLPDGRRAQIVNSRAESGNFLGRIVLGETRKSTVPLSLISPAWFRSHMRPFLSAAVEAPFFFAWRPQTYPLETGFAWLLDDPMPAPVGPSNLLAFELKLGGIA